MKHTRNTLLTFYLAAIAVGLLMVALWETDVLPVAVLTPHSQTEFVLVAVMELITIATIPLALRMMKTAYIRRKLRQGGVDALRRWSMVRLLMICLPMLANTVLYYLYMSTTFGYMGIILLLCLAFVFPSMGKCHYELHSATEE